jgi:AcrR family transcriptional regulator
MSSAPALTRQPLAADTAERILAAAEQQMRRFGLRRVSMGDVARAAGVSRGSIYRYYSDRDALVGAVLERAADRFVEGSKDSVRRRRTLAAQVAEAAVFIREHRDDPLMSLAPPGDQESLLAMVLAVQAETLLARWVEYWLPFLADAESRGEIRRGLDHRRAAEWIVRVLMSLTLMPSVVVDLDDRAAVRAFVEEFIVQGLQRGSSR